MAENNTKKNVNTGLISLEIVARYNQINIHMHSVVRNYGITTADISPEEIIRIAQNSEFKIKKKNLSVKELANSKYPMPAILRKKNGDYLVLLAVKKEENRAILEDARQKYMAGEWNLGDCINKANDDLTNVSPYYLVRNVHKDELIDAAVTLNVGDVSEIVEVEGALYVFMRVPETATEDADGNIQSTLSLQLTNLLSNYQWAIVGDAVEAAKANVQIELNDYGKSIDLVAMQ
jgi:hypothetical protein